MVVGYDNSPPAALNVGGTGQQTWDFSTLSISSINSLKFVDPASTNSATSFPNADLAIERFADTLFFRSSPTAFEVDGIAGDGFGFGVSLTVNFNPNATQMEFPATLNSTYTDTAVFDTIVSCVAVGFGTTCDSAIARRRVISTSTIDAYGTLTTPGGEFETVRQHLVEVNRDTVWLKLPFVGWMQFFDSASTVHNYRWMANGEDWPVLNTIADGAGGDIISAEYIVGDQVLGFVDGQSAPSCHDACDGSASVFAVGGLPPYGYQWSNGQTTATATGLCPGMHTVTISDSDTSSFVVEVEISNPSAISISGTTQGSSGNGDGAIDINVIGGAGGYTYLWSGPDGFTATTADISGLDSGSYTVTVTDQNGCDTSRTFAITLTGITNIGVEGFKLFPNPADQSFTLRSTNLIDNYRVTDLLGNVLFIGSPHKSSVSIDAAAMASGIYLVEVTTVRGTYLNKITVKH